MGAHVYAYVPFSVWMFASVSIQFSNLLLLKCGFIFGKVSFFSLHIENYILQKNVLCDFFFILFIFLLTQVPGTIFNRLLYL